MKNYFVLFFATFIVFTSGCASHKQATATPVLLDPTKFIQDPQKRVLADKGPLFRGQRTALKAEQFQLERELAAMEAERIKMDAAQALGLPYAPKAFGAPEQLQPQQPTSQGRPASGQFRGLGSNTGATVRSPSYSGNSSSRGLGGNGVVRGPSYGSR